MLIAAENGHKDIVQLLVTAKADLSKTDLGRGGTALHWAASNGHKQVVSWLLEKDRTNATVRALDGGTALQWAAFKGHRGCCKVLMQHTGLDEEEMADLTRLIPTDMKARLKLRQCTACERSQDLGEKKFKKCARCQQVRYCSTDCQRAHWREHKRDCCQ